MKKAVAGGLAAVLVLAIAVYFWLGRSDPVAALLNEKWPPVTVSDQRKQAVQTALTAMRGIDELDLAAGIDTKSIETVLKSNPRLKAFGLTKSSVETEQQLLRIEASFSKIFGAEDLPEDSRYRQTIEKLKPDVAGKLIVYFGVTGGTEEDQKAGILRLRLLPAFKRLEVDHVKFMERLDATGAVEMLAGLLNRYADNVTAFVSGLPFMKVSVPTRLLEPIDPSGTFKITGPQDIATKVTVTSQPISPAIHLGVVSWLVSDGKVIAFAQFSGETISQPGPEPVRSIDVKLAEDDFSVLRSTGLALLGEHLDVRDPAAGAWVALSKRLVAKAITDAFSQARPCIEAQATIPTNALTKTVAFPDESTIDCSPDRNCSGDQIDCSLGECPGPRNCPLQEDKRSCGRCSRYKILQFHGLDQPRWEETETCVNDPVCETAKAAQNAAYRLQKQACDGKNTADHAACMAQKASEKLQCETGKKAWMVDCEQIKSRTKLTCEAEKEAFKRLSHSGKFANLDIRYQGTAAAKVCVSGLNISEQLDAVTISFAVAGDADIDTNLKFTPLDIVGHLTCPIPWTEARNFHASIPAQDVRLDAKAKGKDSGGLREYEIAIDKLALKMVVKPSPSELILTSTNMNLSCGPVAGLLRPVAVALAPLVPEMRGEFEYKMERRTLSFKPSFPEQTVMGVVIQPAVRETGKALVGSAAIKGG